jgi:hypothetical protein
MTTMAENERLAVVEVEVRGLRADVNEVKGDVKTLISAVSVLTAHEEASALAAKTRGEVEGRIGVWVRTFLPLGAALTSILISLYVLYEQAGG